jgi:antitoxin (DNA-binding transcriptional repressor) of toxin-antitoxin stability system
MNVSVEEVEKDPHAYLHRVLEGETVVVFEKDRAVAEMRPLVKRAGKRPIGLAKGEFVVPDDFDDPHLPHVTVTAERAAMIFGPDTPNFM